jgi:hypothetical protein
MSEPPEQPRSSDLPASALLLMVAASFVGVGTDSIMNGDIARAIVSYLVGTGIFVIGVSWHWLKPALTPKLSAGITEASSDFRWWLAIVGMSFLVLGFPTIQSGYFGVPPRATGEIPSHPTVGSPGGMEPQDAYVSPPQDLKGFTNEELRLTAYSVYEVLNTKVLLNVGEEIKIREDRSLNDSERAKRILANQGSLNKIFREKYLVYCTRLNDEMQSRLAEKSPFITDMIRGAAKSEGIIDQGRITIISNSIRSLAQGLR